MLDFVKDAFKFNKHWDPGYMGMPFILAAAFIVFIWCDFKLPEEKYSRNKKCLLIKDSFLLKEECLD